MLELIVLGQIPGTSIVINSTQATLALLIVILLVSRSRNDITEEIQNQQTIDDIAI